MNGKLNLKHEIRNPKQTRILKIKISKTENISNFDIKISDLFRNLIFGFFNNLFGYMIHENIYFCLRQVRVSGDILMNTIPTGMFGHIHRIVRRFDKPL